MHFKLNIYYCYRYALGTNNNIPDSEDAGLKVEVFRDHGYDHDFMIQNSHYIEVQDTVPSFNDCYAHKSTYEDTSPSDDDTDGQRTGELNNKRTNDSEDDKSIFEHTSTKRRKFSSDNAIDNTLEQTTYNHWQENEASVSISKSENNRPLHMDKGQHLLAKMGHIPGKGLGKYGQGVIEPIIPSTQFGRRGIGHHNTELEEACLKWNPNEEEVKMIEDFVWLINKYPWMLASEELENWMKLGPKKLTIDDETTFCNPEMVTKINNSKTIFDSLSKAEMRNARTRSNPYETIRSANFLNRAAVKMANINKVFYSMFTDTSGFKDSELLYFADVCAGPGGFSEYILSVKKWHAKGFGFTLKNENDFTLDEFFAGPCETFHPFYGPTEDGNVFDPKNQEEFKALVMKHTYGKGVHFMMSDGGFSVAGKENIQEILSKQLYLCQCLVALMIVRTGGHFVTKLFDLFTPFSAGLVYLMYRCFEKVCIFKPNSSRPANSERYLVCRKKRSDTEAVMKYLSHVNHLLLQKDDNNDVIQLVPLDILKADQTFFMYLKNSNDILGKKQAISLLKIAAYTQDPTLIELRQAEMRKTCLKFWNLSDQSRVKPQSMTPQDKIKEILSTSMSFMGCDAIKLTMENAKSTILDQPYDWYYVPCNSGRFDNKATFYLGLGRRRVYYYVRGKWESIGDIKLELPPNTLVYAELVFESRWTGKDFTKSRALHILDAYMLGGENLSKKYISDR